jgi:hypothetical protein
MKNGFYWNKMDFNGIEAPLAQKTISFESPTSYPRSVDAFRQSLTVYELFFILKGIESTQLQFAFDKNISIAAFLTTDGVNDAEANQRRVGGAFKLTSICVVFH